MNLVIAHAEIWEEQGYTFKEAQQEIEKVGRVCYNSYDRLTDDSYISFVGDMVTKRHFAPTEHGSVYLGFLYNGKTFDIYNKYKNNPYSKATFYSKYNNNYVETWVAVSTNLRVIFENKWSDDLQYICAPTEYHEKRITVQFTIDRGVSAEFNRNRANSPMERSTRYCNFSKDKYSHSIDIIIPQEIDYDDAQSRLSESAHVDYCAAISKGKDNMFDIIDWWLYANLACEKSYMKLIELGWTAQQARRVLPLDLKTILIHTAFLSDWKHFFDLRALGTTGAPHPDAKFVAMPLYEKFCELGYLKNTKTK